MQRCSKLSYITLLSFPTCFAPIDFRVVGIVDGPIAALDSGQPSKRVCVSVCVCVCVCLSVCPLNKGAIEPNKHLLHRIQHLHLYFPLILRILK